MFRFPIVRRLHLAFGSAVLILLAVGAVSYRGLDASSESDRWVAHTHEVLENLQLLRLSMMSIEANDRRFVLTGNKTDLDSSRASLKTADGYAAVVGKLTVDNPVQQRRLPGLQALLDEKRRHVEAELQLRGTQLPAVVTADAVVRESISQRIVAQSQLAVLQMQDEELRLLAKRRALAAQDASFTKLVLIFGTELALLITAWAGWIAQRNSTRRERAEAALKRTNEALKSSNDDLANFAYVASHDLQEPLRMVAGFLKILSGRYKGQLDPEADRFIDLAVDGAGRMQFLIQDLLAYSVIDTSGVTLVNTSSEDALHQAMMNLQGAIDDSGALVTHDPLPAVMADARQLTQLFQNLLANGIKYQNLGVAEVHISATRSADKKWLFAVKDNGVGIEPQYFEKIFGMFQRIHGPTEFKGTGIGLAICKKIVDRHGGSITVQSQFGEGSTFSFALLGAVAG
jgi:signal transduction histidine kinase